MGAFWSEWVLKWGMDLYAEITANVARNMAAEWWHQRVQAREGSK